ncbi:MAG: glutaredoxin family protein [Thiobacillus sp.]|nr:glutaredoxin family protein [Thiobacillus sp.]
MTELVLYSRPGCHLCDEMRAGLAALRPQLGFALREIEVGWEGELAEKYGRLLPVLELAGREVCHYFLDEERLQAALA